MAVVALGDRCVELTEPDSTLACLHHHPRRDPVLPALGADLASTLDAKRQEAATGSGSPHSVYVRSSKVWNLESSLASEAETAF
jgi:hypothetical protein